MRIWGVYFRSPAALNKAATTALSKDKAVRAHKVRVILGRERRELNNPVKAALNY